MQQQSWCRPVDGLEDLLRRDAEGLFILVLPLPEVAATVNTRVTEIVVRLLVVCWWCVT